MVKKINTWEKLGQLFVPSGKNAQLLSHASNPLAIHLNEDVYRVFYSGRDHNNKSSVGFVDVDIVKLKVVNDHEETVFSCGNQESFYSHGVSIGNIYSNNGKKFILFMGWQIPEGGHWRGDIGRLELADNEKLIINPPEAFMTTDAEDPVSLSYPWVTFHNGIYKMWYGSTITWKTENGEMLHVIKYATSSDGNNWTKHGQAIPSKLGLAQAFSRPTVLINDIGYHMWYSYRKGDGTKYKIGYSTSSDGLNWENHPDNSGLENSVEGWDSEMVCYPYVLEHNNEIYMLYNGNQFGKTGFGIAQFKK